MFQNLLGNALKYRNPAVPLQIHISSQPSNQNGKPYHLIEVRDNGLGFEQQFSDKIFQLFTRLHGSSTHAGSGVGLSTVKKVVDNHKGFIKVESQPGNGAAFRVFLPFE